MIRFRIASFLFSIQSELTQLVAGYSLITLPISPPLVVHLLILITFTKLINLPSSMALTIGLKYSYLHTLLIWRENIINLVIPSLTRIPVQTHSSIYFEYRWMPAFAGMTFVLFVRRINRTNTRESSHSDS